MKKRPKLALSINHFMKDEICVLNGTIRLFGYLIAQDKLIFFNSVFP
jgi:hypothetical protein